MKYSIIVPVYNVEKYIDKCLDSIYKQTYKNYEVIIVNDGTKDNSVDIINKYVEKDERFKLYSKPNGGLSDARNYGVKKATGDVIIFIDSDDYIERNLLSEIEKEMSKNKNVDVVRFHLKLVNENGLTLEQPGYKVFSNIPSKDAYKILLENNYVDVACGYAYKKDFFTKNKFQYAKGKIHEDLGLTHLILVKAKNISSIDCIGYNYVQRDGSITQENNEKQNIRKANDVLYHLENYINILENDNSIDALNKKLLLNHATQAVIEKTRFLTGQVQNRFIKLLKKKKIYQYMLNDTMKNKIKRNMVRFCFKLYVKKVRGN